MSEQYTPSSIEQHSTAPEIGTRFDMSERETLQEQARVEMQDALNPQQITQHEKVAILSPAEEIAINGGKTIVFRKDAQTQSSYELAA